MKVTVDLELRIKVEVEEGTTLEEAEQIALFHADLTPSLPQELDGKFIDIDVINIDINDVSED